jgi:hypothetical protein
MRGPVQLPRPCFQVSAAMLLWASWNCLVVTGFLGQNLAFLRPWVSAVGKQMVSCTLRMSDRLACQVLKMSWELPDQQGDKEQGRRLQKPKPLTQRAQRRLRYSSTAGHVGSRQVILLEKPCHPVLDQTPTSWPGPSLEEWKPTAW